MDSIVALKAELQRDLAKESMKKPQHRMIANTNKALVNRSRIPLNVFKNANAGSNSNAAQVKGELGYGIPSTSTSGFVFKGPAMGISSKNGRSCECNIHIPSFRPIVSFRPIHV